MKLACRFGNQHITLEPTLWLGLGDGSKIFVIFLACMLPVVLGAYNGARGTYVPIYGPTHSERNPDFHQLNVRFDKTWKFNTWAFSLYLDVQNIYSRQNTESLQSNYNFTRTAPVAGIPILPALGIRADF